ncbi:MAG: ectoine/hydroxyectoine ABC transporter substrate-binding protein EhuB [Rhodospirillales bacterium]|nr:ectoine/hydroxyectoine ABC transporter substrate-binding protein EhuB [Rhodospirillales bacterium]
MLNDSISRRYAIAAGALALATAFAVPIAANADAFTDKVKKDGITVAYAEESPWAFLGPDKKVAGTDPEVIDGILKKMGVKEIKYQNTEWSTLVPGVRAKRFDMAITGIFIKPDRCTQVIFTDPIMIAPDGMIVMKGNPKKINGFDAFVKDRSLKMGTTIGGTGPRDHALAVGVNRDQIVELPDTPTQIAAMKAGRIHAALNTDQGNVAILEQAKDTAVEVARPFKQAEKDGKLLVGVTAFAFQPDAGAFVKEFNKHLATVRGSPEHLKILKKYGLSEDALPAKGVTTAMMCKG